MKRYLDREEEERGRFENPREFGGEGEGGVLGLRRICEGE